MYRIRLHLEPNPDGIYTVTSPDVPGLVTGGSSMRYRQPAKKLRALGCEELRSKRGGSHHKRHYCATGGTTLPPHR
jgi:hypothetical protein